MIKHTVMALIAVFLLFALSACMALEPFEQGDLLTADEVEARRDALLAEKEEGANTPYDGTCYWLATGTVYHLSPDCAYVAGKESVQSGTVDDARAAGKERVCSRCGD